MFESSWPQILLDTGETPVTQIDMPIFISNFALVFASSVALVANGSINDYEKIAPHIKKHSRVIAVDGGLCHCHAMKIKPDLIVGDCDSIPLELLKEYAGIPVQKHPCDKDATDTELAIQQADSQDTKRITLFGALGNRTDHSLGNLHLLRRYPNKVFIETENEIIFAIEGKVAIECKPGQTIAFLPLGPVSGITSQGLKWELVNASFNKNFMSISNICLGTQVMLSIEHGDLICCIQKEL